MGENDFKKGYSSLNDRTDATYALIDKLREHEPVARVCAVFDVPTSSYHYYKKRCRKIDAERLTLRSLVKQLLRSSRNAAGNRSLVDMMRALGHDIGRFKVRRLMKEAALVSKQSGSHAYKVANTERPDIPNHLDLEFEVVTPNTVWCGDVTYV